MEHPRNGQVAVIFISEGSGDDRDSYLAAGEAMAALVAQQPGFMGVDWIGAEDGREITISYWADDASATGWRHHPEHTKIRDQGRGSWLKRYDLMVGTIHRGHQWERG